MEQRPMCMLEDRMASASAWPSPRLAGTLLAMRSGLSCYRTGSNRCRACHFAMELPLALARASDRAEQEGDSAAAQQLLESAVRAAGSLAPAGCGPVSAFG